MGPAQCRCVAEDAEDPELVAVEHACPDVSEARMYEHRGELQWKEAPRAAESDQLAKALDTPKATDELAVELSRFIRTAIIGRPVTLLLDGRPQVQRVAARLRLDRSMQRVHIQGADANIHIAIERLRDMYTVGGDGERAFPSSVIEGLSVDERERLVRICYQPQVEQTHLEVCHLEASQADLKILMLAFALLQRKAAGRSRCGGQRHTDAGGVGLGIDP
mmetsp:Transcript_30525/g.87184  ORF Transcript_30525/g.87184 Transcript_30525/m.87184 type:complete len:220 (-) Transcript_30525:8-667(-)